MALSEYALKYGPSDDDLWKDDNIVKSGLTPLSATTSSDPEAMYRKSRRTVHQRRELNGFSSRDLLDIGSITKIGSQIVLPNNLRNPIHPIYAPERWKKFYQPLEEKKTFGDVSVEEATRTLIGDGYPGRWAMENPLIKDILLPALRCASMMITHPVCTPWLQAFVCNDWQHLPEVSGRSNLHRVPRLEPQRAKETKKDFEAQMELFSQYIKLCIDINEPETRYGLTVRTHRTELLPHRATIFLSSWVIKPLLRSDLTPEERLIANFQVIETLVHETAHAIAFLRDSTAISLGGEPYFDLEIVAEAGHSFIQNTLGANFRKLPTNREGVPTLAVTYWKWPLSVKSSYNKKTPCLLPGWSQRTTQIRALPIEYIERLQRTEYWDWYVSKYLESGVKVFSTLEPILERNRATVIGYQLYNFEPSLAEMIHEPSEPDGDAINFNQDENDNQDDDRMQGVEVESPIDPITALEEIRKRKNFSRDAEYHLKIMDTRSRITQELEVFNRYSRREYEIRHEYRHIATLEDGIRVLAEKSGIDCYLPEETRQQYFTDDFESVITAWAKDEKTRSRRLLLETLWHHSVREEEEGWYDDAKGERFFREVCPNKGAFSHFWGLKTAVEMIAEGRAEHCADGDLLLELVNQGLEWTRVNKDKLDELRDMVEGVMNSLAQRKTVLDHAMRAVIDDWASIYTQELVLPDFTDDSDDSDGS